MIPLNIKQGDRFNQLTILEERPDGGRYRLFLVKCDCGVEKVVPLKCLRSGVIKSCGCLGEKQRLVQAIRHGHNTRKRGPSRMYMTWAKMLARGTNEKDKSYINYGGRGIKVCKRWFEFENFLADMGKKPEGMSIDRINNSKGYYPKNCRWATPLQQSQNRRSVRKLRFKGKTQIISEWSREIGLSADTISSRLKAGWTIKEALTTPKNVKSHLSTTS